MMGDSRIAILPARGGSKRLPGKNIRPFCGKPIISYPLEAARASGLFGCIHVSTDDPSVRGAAEAAGFPIDFLRPPHLSDDHTPLVPVLRWVLEEFQRRGRTFSDVCLILPCSPLIEPEDLRAAYSTFCDDPRRLPVLSVMEFPVPVQWALELGADGTLTPVHPGQAAVRSQDLAKRYHDSGNFIFYSAESLLSATPPDARGYRPYFLPRTRGLDIDGAEDFALAEALFLGRQAFRRSGQPGSV